ncbi:hypothetical protein L2E82_25535 [Cichorium intybus]|uniref:Uncharacterized protein n=1 Tax=Cichorium intybus TaxID=13427 RepID=A0ACB9E3Y3_CICIN|nr:hypothetical protein L2E82_25535 [Cichorium intybus]
MVEFTPVTAVRVVFPGFLLARWSGSELWRLGLRLLEAFLLLEELRTKPCPLVLAAFSGGSQACMYKLLQIIEGTCEAHLSLLLPKLLLFVCKDQHEIHTSIVMQWIIDMVNLIVDGCLKQPPKREERARDVACCSESKTELVPLKERAAAMVVVLRWLCWVAELSGRQWLEIDGGKRSDTMDRSSRLLWVIKIHRGGSDCSAAVAG